jgi:hypothetical protein
MPHARPYGRPTFRTEVEPMTATSGPIRITIDVSPGVVHGTRDVPEVQVHTARQLEPEIAFDPPAAEVAECGCPEACERDHENE